MQKTYYTPKIEEFHVGFEFEVLMYYKNDPVWIDRTFCNTDSVQSIEMSHSKDSFRVKHLDREDIESFSKTDFPEVKFEYDNNSEPIPSRDGKYLCPTAYALDDQLHSGELWMLYHYEEDNMVWIEYIKDCGGMGYIFKGIVNNKSELKRILKQLGI
tara:strand:+ start:1074 stop:1544 length:471 start_codon:yes stop_codon:yes gene_type:complete